MGEYDISKVLPYLSHPLSLVGYTIFLLFGFFRVFLKTLAKFKVFTRLTGERTYRVLSRLLNYGFIVAILIVALGFALEAWRIYQSDENKEAIVPLDPTHAEQFKSAVYVNAQKFENDPVHPQEPLRALGPFVDATGESSAYEKEFPLEVALLYRVYASAYITNADKKEWSSAYKKVRKLLVKSSHLFEKSTDKLPEDDLYFHKVVRNLPSYVQAIENLEHSIAEWDKAHSPTSLRETIKNIMILAMPSSTTGKIQARATLLSDELLKIDRETSPDYLYLIRGY